MQFIASNKAKLKNYVVGLLATLVTALFVTPPIVYIYKFGMSVTADHTRWAEFGSAMSGIYAPLLGALTLVVLGFQVSLQRTLANHQRAQDYITSNSETLDSHLQRLHETLSRGFYQKTPADDLRSVMASNTGDLDDVLVEAINFAREFPNVFVGWGAINAILSGFKMHPHAMYQHAFSTSKLKVQSYFDYELCHALDNYHFTLTKGRSAIKYEFNEKLNDK